MRGSRPDMKLRFGRGLKAKRALLRVLRRARLAPLSARTGQAGPNSIASENFVPHVRDFSCARRASPFAAIRPRTARAARTDNTRRMRQSILDPGDVEYIRNGVESLGCRLGNTRFTPPLHAVLEQRVNDVRTARAVGIQRRREIHTNRQYMRVPRHVAHPHRVAAIKQRALAVAQHRDL